MGVPRSTSAHRARRYTASAAYNNTFRYMRSRERGRGEGEEGEDEEANTASVAEGDYGDGLGEVEGVEIEGVEIDGVDLSGISSSESASEDEDDEDSDDSSAEGLAQQLKRRLEKREEEDG